MEYVRITSLGDFQIWKFVQNKVHISTEYFEFVFEIEDLIIREGIELTELVDIL